MDTNKIDKIDTNLVVPSIQENLIEIERDKWGNILNEQTFKTLNNNMKVMKEILLEIANENNVTNLDSIKLRLNNLETDRDSIESIVDNNTNGLINVGINERKLNLKGTELEFNSNKVDLDNVAYTNRENTFSENINNTKVYKLKGGTVLENIDNKIKIGNISNKLDLQTTDGTFLVNGEEFRLSSEEVKALLDTTDFQATETINGTSKIATQTEVDNGLENTKIVTSKKLKARLDTLLAGITSTYVLKTDNATETAPGIAKIYSEVEAETTGDEAKKIVEAGNGDQQEYVGGTPTGKTVWSKLIDKLDHTKILTVKGLIKILRKIIKPATENEYGLTNNSNIKSMITTYAPKPDLSPYQLKTNFWKYADSSLRVVGTNSENGHSYAGVEIQMFNNAGVYTGTFHTNGGRAYYKVPNRNGGNWNEIVDNHDLNNYVRDLRMSGYVVDTIFYHNVGIERNGYVVTGVVQNTGDYIVDLIQMRALQMDRGGNWYNVPFA